MAGEDDIFSRLSPRTRTLAGLVLALSNLMVVLDLTIANVSVPHIAGNLGGYVVEELRKTLPQFFVRSGDLRRAGDRERPVT